ncbi:MAG: hypothetical protein JWM47_2837, partial [Acidimicrobiales bacterium]|nr:hypothetical protein [Acidimicrobiales bacterium]
EASEEELYELGKDLQAAADAMIEKMWAIAQR